VDRDHHRQAGARSAANVQLFVVEWGQQAIDGGATLSARVRQFAAAARREAQRCGW